MTATKVRLCRECQKLRIESVSLEVARFPRLDIVQFECVSVLKHVEFEHLPLAPRRPRATKTPRKTVNALVVMLLLAGTVVPVKAVSFSRGVCLVDGYWINSFDCGYGSFAKSLYHILFGWD